MMSTEIQWEGHSILVHTQPAPKYLWMATETVAKVDGIEIGRSGGFGFTETLIGTFPHNNHSSDLALEMKVDLITLASIPYKLAIEGNIISEGRQKVDNWVFFLFPTAILISCLCCFTTFMFFILLNLFHATQPLPWIST